MFKKISKKTLKHRFPVLAARMAKQQELVRNREAVEPLRYVQKYPSCAAQILHVVRTVSYALCDIRPLRIALAEIGETGSAACGYDPDGTPRILVSWKNFKATSSL